MALPSSRSAAWSALTRHALHPQLPPSPLPSRSSLLLHALPARRTMHIMRERSSLPEKDDRLNEPLGDSDIEQGKPRWAYTPPGLQNRYGFQLKTAENPRNSVWHVNDDPQKLDDFYDRFLGPNGARMLPEELRWLAVTHKSFDYGRRGYNTKLAFFGRQILVLEAMNRIMAEPGKLEPHYKDPWKREAFRSPALENVDKLSITRPGEYLPVSAIARVGLSERVDQIMRWKPKDVVKLGWSGQTTVVVTTVLAIIGAVSLQQGGAVASQIARTKVLDKIKRDVST